MERGWEVSTRVGTGGFIELFGFWIYMFMLVFWWVRVWVGFGLVWDSCWGGFVGYIYDHV